MAETPRSRSLSLIGIFYLAESLLRMPSIESRTVVFGRFLFARSAYACQLGLIVLGFFAAVAVLRRRSPGRTVGMGLSLLGVWNALLILVIPESRHMLIDLGARIGLDEHAALVQMSLPYLVCGVIHAFCFMWLMTHAAAFRTQSAG